MTDRELLERAAKAAGIKFVSMDNWPHQDECRFWRRGDYCDCGAEWNPLTDNSNALRLAVKLRIGLDHNRSGDQQRYVAADRPGCEGCFSPVCCVEEFEDESQRDAATRRVIVRAAAAIADGNTD